MVIIANIYYLLNTLFIILNKHLIALSHLITQLHVLGTSFIFKKQIWELRYGFKMLFDV